VEHDLVDVEVAAGGQVAGHDLQGQPRPGLAGDVDRPELAPAGALDRPAEGVGAGDRLAAAVLAQDGRTQALVWQRPLTLVRVTSGTVMPTGPPAEGAEIRSE
jgi:hypothetical protein